MKKMFQWVMAATLICGIGVLASCKDDNDDAPAKEKQGSKERTEFVGHISTNLKTVAENLNFESWKMANALNLYFNEYVLNNEEFEKTFTKNIIAQVKSTAVPVEEGSELAKLGYKSAVTVDFNKMNYSLVMNTACNGWDIKASNQFEMILNGYNTETQQVEQGIYKAVIKFSENSVTRIARNLKLFGDDVAVLVKVPEDLSFALLSKIEGNWVNNFIGNVKIEVQDRDGSNYLDLKTDAWKISGTVKSSATNLMGIPRGGKVRVKTYSEDNTNINFSVAQDPATHKSNISFDFVQNDKKIITLSASGTNTNGMTDTSQLTNGSGIVDILYAVMQGNSIDDLTVTLNDDLTTKVKVSDAGKFLDTWLDMSYARRDYADQETIDQYTQQLNQLFSGNITLKGSNQIIPMRLATAKFGVDYFAMPALKFNETEGYVPLTEMLDMETLSYGFNIVDHAAEPMQNSIIVARQLVQFITKFVAEVKQTNE